MKRGCLLVASVVMFGCQSATMAAKHTLKPALPIPPSNGWTKPRLGNIGFTMMLPEGWEATTLGEKRAPSAGPQSFSDAVLGGWSEKDTGFMAMGSGDPSGKPDAFYMVIATRSLKDPGTKVDADIADMAFDLKHAGMSLEDIKRTTVDLPVGIAEKVQYKIKSPLYEETTETYFLIDGDYHFRVMFSSSGNTEVALPGDAVMTTFRTDWMSNDKSN